MALVGVDEAGKGPVLGSMFAAAVRVPDGVDLPEGLADSKRLTPDRRETLCELVRGTDEVQVALAEVPVSRIDDPGTDMNRLTVAAHAEALAEVAGSDDLVRCDAADVDPDRFGRRVTDAVLTAGVDGLTVRAEHRADECHDVVSAAGIVAKVARDAHVADLAAEYGAVGSGYPGDPTTKRFLDDYVTTNGQLPDCARASWATSERALAAVEQAGLGEF